MTVQPAPPAACPCGRPAWRRGLCVTCYRHARQNNLIELTPQRHRFDVAEDVEWMIDSGERHPEAVATRLGYRNIASLYRALHRANRGDLVDKLTKHEGRI